ncbi:MAG: hypothetical protein AAGG51_09100 [Cyanobacteria bacterium P01_G01_bin.54]
MMQYLSIIPALVLSVTSITTYVNPAWAQPAQLADAVILPSDLPDGFEAESAAWIDEIKRSIDFGQEPNEELGIEALRVQSLFQLHRAEGTNVQIVSGATFWIPDQFAEAGYRFDQESLLALTENLVGETEDILPGIDLGDHPENLGDLANIGDVAATTQKRLNMMGFPIDMQIIVFQREQVFAFVMTGHFVGSTPTVLPADLARLLDQRVQNILANSQTP